MRINKISMAVIFALLAVLSACDNFLAVTPPFIITSPVCEITEHQYVYSYAGIKFSFMNNSQKTVEKITVSFMLFDPVTLSNPFIGSNVFEITKLDLISPLENREIIISLDKYIYTAPREPFLIDFFYISEISYTDGSTWQDKYGTYYVRDFK